MICANWKKTLSFTGNSGNEPECDNTKVKADNIATFLIFCACGKSTRFTINKANTHWAVKMRQKNIYELR